MIGMHSLDDNAQRLETSLHAALAQPDDEPIFAALAGHHPADIADALDRLSNPEVLRVFRCLDPTRAAETLDEIDPQRARYVLDHEVTDRIAALLDLLPRDDAAELLTDSADPERQEALLGRWTDPEDAREVRELLAFPKGSAGRLMTDRFVPLPSTYTVADALAAIRRADPEVEVLTDLYVVDGRRLAGALSLRDLIRAEPERRLTEIMASSVVSVEVETDQEEVARLFSKYDLLSLPVLHGDSSIAGVITVDDVVDVLAEEQTEDILRQGAISAEPGVLNAPYFAVPITRVVRSRVGWLVLLFVAETATGAVLRHFEDELAKVVALSFFVPLLIGTGGNTGAQTVSTIIRGLALREIESRDFGRVLARELASGVLLGLMLGAIAFGRAMLWGSGLDLSLVVALTIVAVCAWANTIGSLIPLLATRLKIDPALVSAPLITTLVDATGLVIYLTIARLLIAQLR